MLTYLIYLLYFGAILLVLLSAYSVYCLITMLRYLKASKRDEDAARPKFNIFMLYVGKDKKGIAAKGRLVQCCGISAVIPIVGIIVAVSLCAWAHSLSVVNGALNSIIATINPSLNKGECTCYAYCTGNKEDDTKCTLELLFGPDEYNMLVKTMCYELQANEKEEFNKIKDCKDGATLNLFIYEHVNDNMVAYYRGLINDKYPDFTTGDGKDRTKMTVDELKEDLKKLLKDTKENGRNPDCKCHKASKNKMKKVCKGRQHWTEGWTWNNEDAGNEVIPNTNNQNNANNNQTPSNNGNGGAIGYNVEVYNILVANPRYSAKAIALATAYGVLEPIYGKTFTIGMMANIHAEGSFGKIEGINFSSAFANGKIDASRKVILSCGCAKSGTTTIDYWGRATCKAHVLAGQVISNASMVDDLLTIPSGVPGIGVGIAQWSGGRRISLLGTYKNSCTTYSQDELGAAEILFMKGELQAGYKGVVTDCSGKSAADCARIICKDYESPGTGSSALTARAATATDLESVLASVTTSGVTSNGSGSSSSNNNQGTGDQGNNNQGTGDQGNNSQGTNTPSTGGTPGEQVVNYALQFVGNHYKWGGTNLTVSGWQNNTQHIAVETAAAAADEKEADDIRLTCPLEGVDCSGFTQAVYGHFGKTLAHSSLSQRSAGTKVDNPSPANMKPGDLVCYQGHVAIYMGEGKVVHARRHSLGIVQGDSWDHRTVLAVRRIFN